MRFPTWFCFFFITKMKLFLTFYSPSYQSDSITKINIIYLINFYSNGLFYLLNYKIIKKKLLRTIIVQFKKNRKVFIFWNVYNPNSLKFFLLVIFIFKFAFYFFILFIDIHIRTNYWYNHTVYRTTTLGTKVWSL